MNRSHAWMAAILAVLSACFALTAWRQTGENIAIILAAVSSFVAALVAFQGRATAPSTEPEAAARALRPAVPASQAGAPFEEPSRDAGGHDWLSPTQTLEQQIESAAEAAKRYSRTLGVIYVELDCYAELEAKYGAGPTRRAIQGVSEMNRGKLRQYDVVSLDGDDGLIVSVAFIREKSELLTVGHRLRESIAALKVPDLGNHTFAPRLGFAMYPLHGYSAGELIAFARTEANAALGGPRAQVSRALPAAG